MGFIVTPTGDLYTKSSQSEEYELEYSIMTPELYRGFQHNGVDFEDDYSKWTQQMMIKKMCTVMGVERHEHTNQSNSQQLQDPDESYVLTVDNVTKILAIQMRFRYFIHV